MNSFIAFVYLVNHDPFSPEEKEYIYKWVEEYQKTNDGNIPWKLLQPIMKNEFGKFRSQSALKNTWISKKRQLKKAAKVEEEEEHVEEIVDKDEFEDESECEIDEIGYEHGIEHEVESEARPSTKMQILFILN